ncbi:LysR family transcriptional regulator [Bradyrhizobium sp. CCBAU 53351]|uniref:LysR family transcriptional regulator n=1 Tax=Bradyrhizobium sp. CCBAU 53351 TaxID=1325114 RepID=UPI001886F375|nr:LysR family transcriptional regulator [Bradyrhizobium sp. CCBAU 53351]QOZ77913.1 LysR family transcriptional regulator [Bradyrhizobium sp. CCBAU 53351]
MARDNIGDLTTFLAVARERSFTKAAAQLRLSPSSLSHTIRGMEERLGVRLLTRTTRSVSLTDAGERLVQTVGPHFEEIDAALSALTELRDKPAGSVRITAGEHAAVAVIWPAVEMLLPDYPDIQVEIVIDHGFTDIVAERFDAGVRLGEEVDKDMIAVPIGPEMRMAVIGTPSYFSRHPKPLTPQDLTAHRCINIRLPTFGGFHAWEFEKDGRELRVRVDGPLAFNGSRLALMAARSGAGLAYLFEDHVREDITNGSLIRVLSDWCPPFSGYHLYYPSRRQLSPAFAVLADALRNRSTVGS